MVERKENDSHKRKMLQCNEPVSILLLFTMYFLFSLHFVLDNIIYNII